MSLFTPDEILGLDRIGIKALYQPGFTEPSFSYTKGMLAVFANIYVPCQDQQHPLTAICAGIPRDGWAIQLDCRVIWGAIDRPGIPVRPFHSSHQALAQEIRLPQGETHRPAVGSGFSSGRFIPLRLRP